MAIKDTCTIDKPVGQRQIVRCKTRDFSYVRRGDVWDCELPPM